jgi:hypothetical protein
MSPRARHHTIVTVVVALGVVAHYVFTFVKPEWINLSPLAGLLTSLFWIWKD